MIRAGAFDEFGQTRTRQFWQAQHLFQTFGDAAESGQGWLMPPPGLEQFPGVPLHEPTRRERLESETELFGFAVSGHPLELFADVAWDTYCPGETTGRIRRRDSHDLRAGGRAAHAPPNHRRADEISELWPIGRASSRRNCSRRPTKATGWRPCDTRCLKLRPRWSRLRIGRGFSLRVLRAGKPRKLSAR